MKEKIITYIKDELSNEPVDSIDAHEDLLGSGLVDSLGMTRLVVFLEREFEVQIDPDDMTVENFMTVDNITKYLNSQLEQ